MPELQITLSVDVSKMLYQIANFVNLIQTDTLLYIRVE